MDYEQIEVFTRITQTSRPYKYGEKEEFKTREEALRKVEREEESLKTIMALQGIYNISEVKHIEESNTFQIVVTIEIPKIF